MANKKPENLSFEEAMTELTQLVHDMEDGELNLEQSLKYFERGVSLVNASHDKLKAAEQKVAIIMGEDTQSQPTPFDPEVE